MKKNNKIMMTIILAIVFAIAAGASVFLLLSPKFTTFYTFKQAYKAGTILTSDMLVPIDAPSSIVVAGAPADGGTVFVTTNALRRILQDQEALKTNVSTGMPLMASMLSITGGSSIEMNMSSNKIAMTISINNITGVTDELTSGSSVNVYVLVEGQSFLIMENMRLLEVTRNPDGALTSATLELTNDEAELLLNALSVGQIYLGLVNSSGYQYRTNEGEASSEAVQAQDAINSALAGADDIGTDETSPVPAPATPADSTIAIEDVPAGTPAGTDSSYTAVQDVAPIEDVAVQDTPALEAGTQAVPAEPATESAFIEIQG